MNWITSLAAGGCLLGVAGWGQSSGPQKSTSQTFIIGGTVVHAVTGEALGQVEVSITPVAAMQNPNGAQSMVTGEDGRFRFEGLSAGKYTLVGERRGFPRQALDEHTPFSTAVAVGPDLESQGIVFRLRPGCSIQGVVTDDLNEPVREAQVLLFGESAQEGRTATMLVRSDQTDDLGHYHFSHLAPGRYFVAVSARPWYAQAPLSLARLAPGQPEASFEMESVEVETAPTEATGEVNSDPAPNPNADSSPEQNHSPLDVAYPLTYYPGVRESNQATALVLQPGEQATADVPLTPVPALRLRIHLENADSPEGFGANLTQKTLGSQGVPVQTLITSGPRKGELDIVGIAPGEYVVNVLSEGKRGQNWKQTVELSDNLEINGAASHSVSSFGGVVTVDGLPAAAQGQIGLRNRESKEFLSMAIGSRGSFELGSDAIEAGSYEVSLLVPNAAIIGMTATGARVAGQTLTIPGTGPVQLAVQASLGLGRVTGVALLEGKPQSGVMVLLVPQDPENHVSRFRRDQSDSDGTFTLPDVVPGKYTVLALQHGWDLDWGRAAVLEPYLAGGETVEIAAQSRHSVKVKVQ
jgi:hypothetical protein